MHGRNTEEIETELAKIKQELAPLKSEFEGHRDRPKTMAGILRWSGVAFIAAGACVVFATRRD
jgi:hypothetical protein